MRYMLKKQTRRSWEYKRKVEMSFIDSQFNPFSPVVWWKGNLSQDLGAAWATAHHQEIRTNKE